MYFQYETEDLILRVLDENNAGQVLEFYNDGDKFFKSVEPDRPEHFYTLEYQARVLQIEMEHFIGNERARYYAFLKKNPGRIIGTVSLFDIKREPYCSATIGYKMLEQYTRQGYGTQMVRRITQAAFYDGGLHRVEAFVQTRNLASRLLLEKVGYEYEGVAREIIFLKDEWVDHERYVCINRD